MDIVELNWEDFEHVTLETCGLNFAASPADLPDFIDLGTDGCYIRSTAATEE
jgi:hypothetical protein